METESSHIPQKTSQAVYNLHSSICEEGYIGSFWCYHNLKLLTKNQNLYKPTEFGAEFHWNEKLDDCSPVNLLNIDWSAG